jgi:hypothetical protein
VVRLKIHGAIPPGPHTASWHGVSLSTGHIFMAWYSVEDRDSFTFNFETKAEEFNILVMSKHFLIS